MNIKKIGMTALAASLVSVSASAGELSVSGSASINAEGYSAPATAGLELVVQLSQWVTLLLYLVQVNLITV